MKKVLIPAMILALMLTGCAAKQKTDVLNTVIKVADTIPGLTAQLDNVYAFLKAQKAIPHHLDLATQALQILDKIAPVVQAGAEALNQPGQFSWAQAAIQLALAVAQVMGYVAPLL
jgi:outer membrane murein-binding lipoprotein Lpp